MKEIRNYKEMAIEIINAMGGKDNIVNFAHCMTRLRVNVKDKEVDLFLIRKIKGVIGAINSGGQIQVIIGQDVDNLFINFEELLKKDFEVNEKDICADKKLTKRSVGQALDMLSSFLTPLIPVIIASSMFKMIIALFGRDMFNVIEQGSGVYQLLNVVADSGFYFLPVFVAYTTAKKVDTNPMISMLLGAILIHPDIINLAKTFGYIEIYGFNAPVYNYANAIIPSILSVLLYQYIERFLRKIVPETIRSVGIPTLSVAIMFPITIFIIAPAGAFVGSYICNGLLGLYNITGALGVAMIGAVFMLLVLTGMHLVLISQLIFVFQTTGQESLVCPAATVASFAVAGVALGSILCQKDKEARNLNIGYLIAVAIGGVTEPTLYGVCIRYKKPIIGMILGGFLGALYLGYMHVTCYQLLPTSSFVAALSFAGPSKTNFINGLIGCSISFIIATFVTYFLDCKDSRDA